MSASAAPARLRYRHASGLHAVSRELQALHRELLRSSGEAHGHVRTSVTNLVAACTDSAHAERAASVLLGIGAEHPARAIVILASPEEEPHLEADVSLHAAADGSHATTELVRLDVAGEPAYHLSGIVTPLLIPDMPTYIWVLGAAPLRQAFNDDTVAMTERMVIDSGAYPDAAATLQLIAEQQQHFGDALRLADLAWERTLPWRELIAQAFDASAARPWLRHIAALAIRCAGARASTEAWLLAGWLASRLDWPRSGGPRVDVSAAGGNDHVQDGTIVDARVEASDAGRHATVSVHRQGECLNTSVDIAGAHTTSRSVTLPQHEEVDLLSGLITDPGDGRLYAAAVAAAVTVIAAAR